MDTISKSQRSKVMSLVRSKNTGPERYVRGILAQHGYRYRIHRNDLPGKPDIVFPGRRKIVFVHGCYWHGHKCKLGRIPKTRIAFWTNKITGNSQRDRKNRRKLAGMGWKVLAIWECQLRDKTTVEGRLVRFLG